MYLQAFSFHSFIIPLPCLDPLPPPPQDNNLAEAFKLRNLLGELQPEVTDARAVAAPLALGSHASGSDMRVALTRKRAAERPVAIVGFCEHIFSDKSGALGSFAASAEFAFGTIVQVGRWAAAGVQHQGPHTQHQQGPGSVLLMCCGQPGNPSCQSLLLPQHVWASSPLLPAAAAHHGRPWSCAHALRPP
jgi:hypothetical protein